MSRTYKSAGVDIEAGDALVDWLKSQPGRKDPNLLAGVGGFAALYRLTEAKQMESPLLVSATDGVGTKLRVAIEAGRFDTIGQDLVAMCVNDIICCGAAPLFFLDYYATGALDLEAAKQFLAGVKSACDKVGASLIGGETAEMPGMYQKGDFDCAGFCVGLVDEKQILGSHRVEEGDVVIAVAGDGFHSNGFSLLRKVLQNQLDEWFDRLLTPTPLYSALVQELTKKNSLHACAHITGGGIHNLSRVIPDGLQASIESWDWPQIFRTIQEMGKIDNSEMLKTFNCGVGLALVLPKAAVESALEACRQHDREAWVMGQIEKVDSEASKISWR